MTPDEKKRCGDAAKALIRAFFWGETEEGHLYWSVVYRKLKQLSGETDETRIVE